MTITLNTKIEQLSRVGKTVAGRLKKLGITEVHELLYYFPFRYVDYSKKVLISQLVAGENVTVLARIELIKNRRSFRKKTFVTEAVASDESGTLKVVWFNQPFLTKVLAPGDMVYLSGELHPEMGEFQFISPMYEKANEDPTHTARIVPIYSLIKSITQKQLRFLMKQALSALHEIDDYLPLGIQERYHLTNLSFALQQIHFPKTHKDIERAAERLKFDELLQQQMKMELSKKYVLESRAQALAFHEKETLNFVRSLAFELTSDQKKAAWQILKDMQKDRPMNRLLEGDVGSGKTVVAAIAFLNCALNRSQGVFMAPTEVLAFQHYEKFLKFLQPMGLRIALMTHTKKMFQEDVIKKDALIEKIKNGDIDIAIGTHALITEDVLFKDIGLVIIDEQHRFGVTQRKALTKKTIEKKYQPHLLSMTATPIPRSLSLILYGDLDISIIKEMPKGRKKIITKIIAPRERPEAYSFIAKKIEAGEQAFVVCPLIDPSDRLGAQSVKEEYERLRKEVFPHLSIGILHGKLKPKEKEEVMRSFQENAIKILVATSVIEVGIDMPNATIMIIEGAGRFGLSQLHQFRGRVGRSDLQSYCFLLTENMGERTFARLKVFLSANDCFELAQKDLEMRGPGEMFGEKQSGFPEFRIARFTDLGIIQDTHECAREIMQSQDQYKILNEYLAKTAREVHLE